MTNKVYVIDTNVLVSAALFPASLPAQALAAVRRHGRLLMSKDAASELARVLARPKFEAYVAHRYRVEFVHRIVRESHAPAIEERIRICRDPKDDAMLELAVAGDAAALVTGDEDLLVLHPFRGIPIVTPKQFLDSVEIVP